MTSRFVATSCVPLFFLAFMPLSHAAAESPAVDPYASTNPYEEAFDPNSTDAMSRIKRAPEFDLNATRDPFVSYLDVESERKRELQAIMERKQQRLREKFDSRPREPMEDFDLTELKLVAILSISGDTVAMMEDSKKNGHVVRVGDYMGKNNGRISKIGDTQLTLVEKKITPSGDIIDEPLVIPLENKTN